LQLLELVTSLVSPKSKAKIGVTGMLIKSILVLELPKLICMDSDIEDTLLAILMTRASGGKKFSKLDVKRVYFGNWLRDYSQAVDVYCLSKTSPLDHNADHLLGRNCKNGQRRGYPLAPLDPWISQLRLWY
jgi:Heterokaryon incompatibility protein Het-C